MEHDISEQVMDRRIQATTVQELDIHLRYVQELLHEVAKGMSKMATKEDVAALSSRMDKFVTQDQFDTLVKKVENSSLSHSFNTALSTITRVGAAFVALVAVVGAIVAFVHLLDRLPAQAAPVAASVPK